uniref:Uncharacterized protein n=1 Tax=Arundo donax TaxID=35708 RepID=A0A0A9UEZ7_ARUDO
MATTHHILLVHDARRICCSTRRLHLLPCRLRQRVLHATPARAIHVAILGHFSSNTTATPSEIHSSLADLEL